MYHMISLKRAAGQSEFGPDCSYIGQICQAITVSGMKLNAISIGSREIEFFFRGPMEAPFLVGLFNLARPHGRMEYNLLAQEDD
jgi:hypothetical protein